MQTSGRSFARRGELMLRRMSLGQLDETMRDPLSGNAVLGGVPITMQPL